jgi:hypothetical protein
VSGGASQAAVDCGRAPTKTGAGRLPLHLIMVVHACRNRNGDYSTQIACVKLRLLIDQSEPGCVFLHGLRCQQTDLAKHFGVVPINTLSTYFVAAEVDYGNQIDFDFSVGGRQAR